MSQRKFWSLVLLLLVFEGTAKADSVTLTIKSWAYTTSSATDSSRLTLVAVDSGGKEIMLTATFPDFTFVGFPNSTYATTATGVTPLSSNIAISPQGSLNSVFNLAASQALPTGVNGTVNVAIGFTGALKVYEGAIFSPTDPRQPLLTTLSFTLASGTGTYTAGLGGTQTLTLTGTGGTLTITPVPEPLTLLLLGSGLAALGLKARWRK